MLVVCVRNTLQIEGAALCQLFKTTSYWDYLGELTTNGSDQGKQKILILRTKRRGWNLGKAECNMNGSGWVRSRRGASSTFPDSIIKPDGFEVTAWLSMNFGPPTPNQVHFMFILVSMQQREQIPDARLPVHRISNKLANTMGLSNYRFCSKCTLLVNPNERRKCNLRSSWLNSLSSRERSILMPGLSKLNFIK